MNTVAAFGLSLLLVEPPSTTFASNPILVEGNRLAVLAPSAGHRLPTTADEAGNETSRSPGKLA